MRAREQLAALLSLTVASMVSDRRGAASALRGGAKRSARQSHWRIRNLLLDFVWRSAGRLSKV